jgi:peptidoglycan/LPS O-acetylase OafA/YrhL
MRTTRRTLPVAVLALTTLSLLGAVVSVRGDLSADYGSALGPDGRLSIPLPMSVAQLVLAVAAASRRRPVALAASGLVAVALLLGVVSGFFDGGYGDDALTGPQRTFQVGFVIALTVVGVLAALRFRDMLSTGRRDPVAQDGAVGA